VNIYRNHRHLIIFLTTLTVLRLIYVFLIPLLPQEAYYWYYSLKPDLSYFDHPPAAAYSIWLGTWIFGNTIFGIKFMAIVWSLLTNIVFYRTALLVLKGEDQHRKKLWAFTTVIFFNLTLFAHIYAVIVVPDSPLLFFWISVIFLILKFQKTSSLRYLYLAGLALGFGMLSKYTAVAILPALFIIILSDPESRKILITPHPYLALFLTVMIFLPVIYWNMENHWVSFGFQFSGRADALKSFQTKYILQLIASQLFILTPLPMILFFRTTAIVLTNWRKNTDAVNLLLTGLFIIGGFLVISLRSLVKMNWLMPGYLGIIVAAVLVLKDRVSFRSVWIRSGIMTSLVLIIIAYSILLVPNIPLGEGNTWSGWRDAAQKISRLQANLGGRDTVFIFTNSYKASSLLKFYLHDDQEVYAQNIFGRPALQFDIWGLPDSLAGKNALYVFSDRYEYKSEIDSVRRFFDRLTPMTTFEYSFMNKKKTRIISCYYAEGYKKPQNTEDRYTGAAFNTTADILADER
jgi:hypothetical protein